MAWVELYDVVLQQPAAVSVSELAVLADSRARSFCPFALRLQ